MSDQEADAARADATTPRSRALPVGLLLTAALVAALEQVGRPIPAFWPRRHPDDSWMVGLQLLRDQGAAFGSNQVFTYGPWGFLSAPTGIDLSDLWLAGLFRAACVGLLFLAVHACLPRQWWAVPVSAVLTLLIGNSSQSGWMLALALCAVMLAHLASSCRPGPWLLGGCAALSALAFQIKFSDGVLAIAVVGLLTLVTGSPRAWALGAGTFFTASIGLWLAAGQRLADLPDWLRLGIEIVGGYDDAMAFTSTSWIVWLMIVGALVATIAVVSARRLPLPARLGALGLVLFSMKTALTRPDGPHVLPGYTLVVLVVLVAFVAGTPLVVRAVAGPTALLLALLMMVNMPILPPRQWSPEALPLDALPAEHADRTRQVKRDLVEDLAISPEVLTALRGHPVSIDPWEISAAWAHDLDWDPLPVFQGYSAYTSTLDEANASALLADPDHRVLREAGTYDEGYQAWESPGPTLALLCSFEEVATDDHWSVYARATDRCGAERSLVSRRVSAGEALELPEPDDSLVLVRFEPDPRPWADRLLGVTGIQRNLLHARLDDEVYRVTEGLASGPLVVGSSEDESVLFNARPARRISFDRAGELEIVEIPLTGRESG